MLLVEVDALDKFSTTDRMAKYHAQDKPHPHWSPGLNPSPTRIVRLNSRDEVRDVSVAQGINPEAVVAVGVDNLTDNPA